ncbi:MAG: TIGR03618 family F420-dependent PPOX class oxidoreductase [Chloroflexi bacterium]|nr:TIGR03618 family F420-dependent PPOX class oxidoreductase [Chloroflexota bacterium]
MTKMTDEARDAFLAETRIGILSTAGEDGWPISVPVWFEWDGSHARVFTSAGSPKVGRLERDPRVSLLVVNNVGEQEYWVAIDGQVEVREEGAAELAKRLADRYWDMTDEEHKKTVDMWVAEGATLRLLEIVPTRIRTYGG